MQTDYRIGWLYVIPKADKKQKQSKIIVFLLEDGGGKGTCSVTNETQPNKFYLIYHLGVNNWLYFWLDIVSPVFCVPSKQNVN